MTRGRPWLMQTAATTLPPGHLTLRNQEPWLTAASERPLLGGRVSLVLSCCRTLFSIRISVFCVVVFVCFFIFILVFKDVSAVYHP